MVYSVGDLVKFKIRGKVRQGVITKIKYHAFDEDEFIIKDKNFYSVAESNIIELLQNKWGVNKNGR